MIRRAARAASVVALSLAVLPCFLPARRCRAAQGEERPAAPLSEATGAAGAAEESAEGAAAGLPVRRAERRGPAAIVGSEIITFGAVMERAAEELAEAHRTYAGEDLERARRDIVRRTLDALVEERLYVLEGRRLAAEHAALKEWIAARADELVESQTRRVGAAARFDKALRERAEEAVLMRFVVERFVRAGATASPDEVRAYYREHAAEFALPAQVRYREIFIPTADFPDADQARARAEWVHRNLAADGRDFADWARRFSRGARAADGGLWDFGQWSTDDAALRERLLAMKVGEISDVLAGPKGWYLFRVEESLPPSQKTFHQAQEDIARRLTAEREERNRQVLLKRLRERFGVQLFDIP